MPRIPYLTDETAPDFDRLKAGAERLAEPTFDKPFEPALEPLESHRPTIVPAGLGYPCSLAREWRNWQTRRIQVPVPERVWGFKSPLAHAR